MNSRIRTHIAILFISITGACIEPFDFESETPENSILVVDARVTNKAGDSYVELHFANPYSNGEIFKDTLPAPDAAVVYLKDQEGSTHLFTEKRSGLFTASDTLFAALPGFHYQLQIELNDGRFYESELIPMPEEVEINEVFWKYTEGTIDKNGDPTTPGYKIFVASETSKNSGNLKYRYTETWEVDNWGYFWYNTYKMQKEFYNVTYRNSPFPVWPYDTLVPKICYQTYKPKRYLNVDRVNESYVAEKQINELSFISIYDSRLKRRYSIDVEQMSVSDEAWEYWKSIEQQKAATGSLFDPVPFKIESNIYCTNSGEAEVAGFFVLGNIVQKRFFINASEIPEKPLFYPICKEYAIWADNPWGNGPNMGWPDLFADNSSCCFICDLCSDFSRTKPDWW